MNSENQDMLFDIQDFIAFGYIVSAMAYFRIFRKYFHAAIERLQVNIHLPFAIVDESILGNIP